MFFRFYTADNASKLKYIFPICALSLVVIAIPLFINRHRMRRCIRGQEEEQQPLIRGNDRDDYGVNQLNEPDEGRRPHNAQNVPQPSSASPSSSSHISRVDKNFNARSSRNKNTSALA